uniref:Translation initiation factor 5A C-terminal domain-containing protein n=1 Tax=Ananas comosus var. bracteatus TaxID=296719 RepID=A0A6V7NP44_ANACO|nr:unnamed protein product [Ananas comosus var. bracteatus]
MVNVMPTSFFKKLGKDEDELKPTDSIMTDFTGNGQQAREVLTTELTSLVVDQSSTLEDLKLVWGYLGRLVLGFYPLILDLVSLLTENGNTKDDLRLPTDESLLMQIKDGFAEGKDLVVRVMSAMGEEQICSLKDIGLSSRHHLLSVRVSVLVCIDGLST